MPTKARELFTDEHQTVDNVIDEHPHLDRDGSISVRVPGDP
jgi:hypothetical protein